MATRPESAKRADNTARRNKRLRERFTRLTKVEGLKSSAAIQRLANEFFISTQTVSRAVWNIAPARRTPPPADGPPITRNA